MTNNKKTAAKKVKKEIDNTLRLKNIVIIGKFDDDKCRQVLIKQRTQEVVLSAILACESEIRVLENVIEGIDLVNQ